MKKYQLLFSLLMPFLLSVTCSAQCQPQMVCIVENEATTASAQIAVQIPDNSPITKIRLNSENSGKSLIKDVFAVKSFFLPVELADGENSFNIIAYTNNKIVFSTVNPIVINRKNSPTIVTQQSNQFSEGTKDKKLRLLGKGSVKNQETYNFEIDASELSPQVGSYAIEILNEDDKGKKTSDSETRKIEQDAGSNRHKQLQSVELKLREGKNTIRVYTRMEGQNPNTFTADLTVECVNCKDQPAPSESIIIRSIVGLEQIGASSARSEQHPFLSLFFSTPVNIGRKFVCPIEKPNCAEADKIEKPKFTFSVWSDIHLTTTPVQSVGSLASFTPAGFASNFVQGDSAGKVNDLVRSFDFLIGFDKQIVPLGKSFPGIFPGKTSLSLIAAGGAISPLSSDKGAVFYKIPTDAANAEALFAVFPEARGKTNIAFVAPERNRFFRQYYAGFRLKTFFSDKETQFLPAMFDVTFGQNEAITNRLQGVIMRIDGSTPFPVSKAGFLYLFGSVNMRLGRSKEITPTFFLEPATNVSLTNADTIVLPLDRSPFQTKDRDVFRIGVGADLFKLFKKEDAPK